ncbi:RNA polymerase sigma factor [Tundrisphaera lichenicola]|uniref:RNA polymerase sigma factor n=1 Tax=Tundrisphaera lichenicola TaxID=2029860 RepID=UPI003EC01833
MIRTRGGSSAHQARAGLPSTMTTRSSLLIRVRNTADPIAWREFIALYKPLLRAYVRKRGIAGQEGDDVVQEILIRLVKALPGFRLDRGRGRFRTWLWRVMLGTLVDRARRDVRRARAERVWVEAEGERAGRMDRGATDGEVEDDDWKKQYRRRLLEYAKAKVRGRSHSKTWACFEEHYLRGRASVEVATELGLTANVVDVNTSRILARLRNVLVLDLGDLFDADDLLPR